MAKYKKPASRIEAWDRISELTDEIARGRMTLDVLAEEFGLHKRVTVEEIRTDLSDGIERRDAERKLLRDWLDTEGQFTDV